MSKHQLLKNLSKRRTAWATYQVSVSKITVIVVIIIIIITMEN